MGGLGGFWWLAKSIPKKNKKKFGQVFFFIFPKRRSTKVEKAPIPPIGLPDRPLGINNTYHLIRMLKQYPVQYTEPVREVIDTLSITQSPTILGSAADRTIIYAADLDIRDNVNWSSAFPRRFQNLVYRLEHKTDMRVTDIKAGVIHEWNILENAYVTKGVVMNYNCDQALDKMKSLYDRMIINKEEFESGKHLLIHHPSPLQFLVAQKALRFGLVRWTPKDVAHGFVTLRDGTKLRLGDALLQRSIVKVDIIAWVESRFIECEAVYNINKDGRSLVLTTPEEIKQGIKESLLIFASEHNWMKVAKRMYSLSKMDNATTIQECLRKYIFNAEIGRLYSILSDAQSLQVLKEESVTKEDEERIHRETDGFRGRLSTITIPALLKPVDPFSKGFVEKLDKVLQPLVKTSLSSLKLLPLPKKWLP